MFNPQSSTPNPHLPSAPADLTSAHTRPHREQCGPRFQAACLQLAQSLWLQKKPAQAILQLNKSAFAETPTSFSFAALKWFLENRQPHLFIGNPVRHFQHLATRMSGPRAEPRTWIAWACFHLSLKVLPSNDFPPDQEQIDAEKLDIPTLDTVIANLPPIERLHFLDVIAP
ncbi:MAG: hypothetical protein ACSHYF_15610 [Verrucomicrobiaceae bacterium]